MSLEDDGHLYTWNPDMTSVLIGSYLLGGWWTKHEVVFGKFMQIQHPTYQNSQPHRALVGAELLDAAASLASLAIGASGGRERERERCFSSRTSQAASKQESKQASKQARKRASKRARKEGSQEGNKAPGPCFKQPDQPGLVIESC